MNEASKLKTTEANLYEFAPDSIEVAFNARPGAENPSIVYHNLRKPTLGELIEREQQSKYEIVELTNREDAIEAEDDMANSRLWDKIAVSVKGYKGLDTWVILTDEQRSKMRIGHKATAIRAMYAGSCEIEGDEDGVSIGPDVWTVKHSIGPKKSAPDFIIRHYLREPTEAERAKFNRSSSSTSYVKGAKKQQIRIKTNLRAYVELYDALIEVVEGGTVNGNADATIAEFRAAIDPVWKRLIVQCLMANLEAQLSD